MLRISEKKAPDSVLLAAGEWSQATSGEFARTNYPGVLGSGSLLAAADRLATPG